MKKLIWGTVILVVFGGIYLTKSEYKFLPRAIEEPELEACAWSITCGTEYIIDVQRTEGKACNTPEVLNGMPTPDNPCVFVIWVDEFDTYEIVRDDCFADSTLLCPMPTVECTNDNC